MAGDLYIGLMTGTSLDAADAVVARFDAHQHELLHSTSVVMPAALREELLALHRPGHNELERAALAGNELAHLYARTVHTLLDEAHLDRQQIAAIGCHGQTVRHRPALGFTLQLGNPALLAELTGLSVVADFRSADIAAGGQGAPLVPAFHAALFRHPRLQRVIVNLGGISNLTHLPPDGPVTGFDCGPANMLLNAWIQQHRQLPFDRDGAWAASGTVSHPLLARLLAEPYFQLPPPKSTGRDLFSLDWLMPHLDGSEAPQDVQATLLHLAAQVIVDAINRDCPAVDEVYLCGGGARNQALVRGLQQLLEAPVRLTDELGVPVEWVEGFAFAWLANQRLQGYPANLPSVTGARHPCLLGAVWPA